MKIPMTLNGQSQLREELARLESSLSEIAAAIGDAIKLGDLSENADYHANKEKQGLVLAKIRRIKSRLASAQVIDVRKLAVSNRVVFGTTVTILNLDSGDRQVYQIVGEDEADVSSQKLSITTPVARAMITQEQGDTIEVAGQDRIVRYKIEKVQYI